MKFGEKRHPVVKFTTSLCTFGRYKSNMTMKKTIFAAIAIMTLCAFASCQEDNKSLPLDYYSSKILGTWKLVSAESKSVPTNEREVLIFDVFNMTISGFDIKHDGQLVWQNKESYKYQLAGAALAISGGSTPVSAEIESITEDEMVLSVYTRTLSRGNKVLKNAVFKKVKPISLLAIDGLWEGVSLTGQQTYGDENHRWEFFAFDQFLYMSQNEDGKWVPDDSPQGEYKIVADWMMTYWKDKDGAHLECWDIAEISTWQMSLSALREKADGTRFETTLTMKRIR